jgi:SAM-dependent methyltransferase
MIRPRPFSPASYWEARYREGRDSGEGSRGETGRAKAQFVNDVIDRHGVASVVDWGCGDGQVLDHITEDVGYLGVDVSATILAKVRKEHPDRQFCHAGDAAHATADMALSMDVLFHFPDDTDYHAYLDRLFASAWRLVLIYATDYDGGRTARHVMRRHFTPDIAARFPAWRLIEEPPRPSPQAAGFFLYRKEEV